MKKAILSLLVLLNFAACAQRLQQRPKSPEATKADAKVEKKTDGVPAAGDQKQEQTQTAGDKNNAPKEIVQSDSPAQAQIQEQQRPAPVSAQVNAQIAAGDPQMAACNVEFQAVSENEGADFMTKISGLWVEGGINAVRNVAPSSNAADLTRSAIQFGKKIDEIVISRVTFKQAEKFTPGQSPLVIATNEKLAQALSYRVSSEINGFRLVDVTTSQTANAKMKCSTFALKLESGLVKTHDILHVIGPIQDQTLKAEEFISSGKQNTFTRAN